jgi:hypothetical protein
MVLHSLAADQLSAPTTTGSAVSPEPSCPGLKQDPQRKSQPSVQEWLVLHERGVIDQSQDLLAPPPPSGNGHGSAAGTPTPPADSAPRPINVSMNGSQSQQPAEPTDSQLQSPHQREPQSESQPQPQPQDQAKGADENG